MAKRAREDAALAKKRREAEWRNEFRQYRNRRIELGVFASMRDRQPIVLVKDSPGVMHRILVRIEWLACKPLFVICFHQFQDLGPKLFVFSHLATRC